MDTGRDHDEGFADGAGDEPQATLPASVDTLPPGTTARFRSARAPSAPFLVALLLGILAIVVFALSASALFVFAIGFLGTVRGIGDALGQAHQAVEGNIAGVTQSLGVAFNSTFVALLISIFLMFLLHQLQLNQERLVLETETYLDRNLIRHLQVTDAVHRVS